MTSKEALEILKHGGVGYTPEEKDEAIFTIKNELLILDILKRNVFETKSNEKDNSSYVIDYDFFNEDDKYITREWFEKK